MAKNFDALGRDDVFNLCRAAAVGDESLRNDPKAVDRECDAPEILFIYLRPTRQRRPKYFVDVEVKSEFENFKEALFAGLSRGERKAYGGRLVRVQTGLEPLFEVPDFSWEIFYGDRVAARHKSIAGAVVAVGINPNSSGAYVRIPLSADSTECVLFVVAKALWYVNYWSRGAV